jgi:DNA-directed RNA polymerase subunit RPC12/RpoP
MLRKVKKIKCPRCGHSFLALDIEDNASVSSVVIRCPKCGKVVDFEWTGISGFLRRLKELFENVNRKDGWI